MDATKEMNLMPFNLFMIVRFKTINTVVFWIWIIRDESYENLFDHLHVPQKQIVNEKRWQIYKVMRTGDSLVR